MSEIHPYTIQYEPEVNEGLPWVVYRRREDGSTPTLITRHGSLLVAVASWTGEARREFPDQHHPLPSAEDVRTALGVVLTKLFIYGALGNPETKDAVRVLLDVYRYDDWNVSF